MLRCGFFPILLSVLPQKICISSFTPKIQIIYRNFRVFACFLHFYELPHCTDEEPRFPPLQLGPDEEKEVHNRRNALRNRSDRRADKLGKIPRISAPRVVYGLRRLFRAPRGPFLPVGRQLHRHKEPPLFPYGDNWDGPLRDPFVVCYRVCAPARRIRAALAQEAAPVRRGALFPVCGGDAVDGADRANIAQLNNDGGAPGELQAVLPRVLHRGVGGDMRTKEVHVAVVASNTPARESRWFLL